MTRTIRTEARKRGFFGKLFKWAFILFNILMVVWLVSYWSQLGGLVNSTGSEAGRAGAAIGGAMGSGFLLFIWLAGDVILGLFTLLTRGSTIVVEEHEA
jgi:hypothetical protein